MFAGSHFVCCLDYTGAEIVIVPFFFWCKWLGLYGLWGGWEVFCLTGSGCLILREVQGYEGIPEGLKPRFFYRDERAKAEALAYLEATALTGILGI